MEKTISAYQMIFNCLNTSYSTVLRLALTYTLILVSIPEAKAQIGMNLDSLSRISQVDSLLIDRNLNNWSVRLFGIAKAQNLRLENDDIDLKYNPNNIFGIGIGMATRKLILDIAINIKDSDTENTNRFDFQGGFVEKKNIFDFYIQVYEGFNINNSINDSSVFRDDIHSVAVGVDYLHLLKRPEMDQRRLLSGLRSQKNNFFTFGYGGFLVYNKMSADSSIVPPEFVDNFNQQAQLTRFTDIGGGIMGGFLGAFRLSPNWYTIATAKAGAGLMIKRAVTEDQTYTPGDPTIYKFNGSVIFGYTKNRFYTYLNIGAGLYLTDLDFGNNAEFNLLNGKMVFGYRFFKKEK